MQYHFLVLALFTTLSLAAQKRFIENLDTTTNVVNSYIQQYTATTFWQQPFANEVIDINNINSALLEAAVFFEINRFRVTKRRLPLKYHSKLNKLADNYVHYYGSNVFDKKKRGVKLFRKSIAKANKAIGFYGGFQSIHFGINYPLRYKKGKTFTIKKTREGRTFYNGKVKLFKKDAKNVNLTPTTVLTYAEWAKNIRQRWFKSSELKDQSFTQLGCAIQVIDENPKAVPQVKVIAILGGYRLQMLSIEK